MKAVDVLEWKFSPRNYFEQEFAFELDGQTMKVGEGIARAEIDSDFFDANPNIRRQLHDALYSRLLGVQLIAREPFTLEDSSRIRKNEDGSTIAFLEIHDAVHAHDADEVEIQRFDADGNFIPDIEQERIKQARIDRKKALSDRIAELRSQDDTLAKMIRSFDGAMRNPKEEFVYLYEIADAATLKFRKKNAWIELKLVYGSWKRFGKLCNNLPVLQGRHRGSHPRELREATAEELHEARMIALEIIEAYLRHLESTRALGRG